MLVIEAREISYTYHPGTSHAKKALDGITLTVERGEFLSLVGANGSGKSTLIQQLNGLLLPEAGELMVLGRSVADKGYREQLWQKVGLVFQFPEQQLFEGTVYDELAYGLKNMGLAKGEIDRRVQEALLGVGIEPAGVSGQSPFSLSGGMRRRVAVASILAMEPEILVLDEPTAGLDPEGSSQILETVKRLQREKGITVLLVSHCLNELILFSDRIAVLEKGRIKAQGKVREVLSGTLGEAVILPEYLNVLTDLREKGWPVHCGQLTLEEAAAEIERVRNRLGNQGGACRWPE
ncbi:ABC transporter related [Desulfitobacterium hafniense DCB-2]|uniref:ABC transporter related n=1 Tax=Desulfitobacterium hafniense (strain DSM 10664 / DCB-2) TaxID=272564 RepID=B8FPT3_DESHD|nr:energy-coupling factor transporter ATPase [Desulfitobacterium hafniense]ACL19747.1 ABC transporter related [Desulfitobacterium hafniense DCB-2]